MELGLVGLGKMAANMAAYLVEGGPRTPVVTRSLLARFVSRQDERYAAKLLAALRNPLGGHAVKKSGGEA